MRLYLLHSRPPKRTDDVATERLNAFRRNRKAKTSKEASRRLIDFLTGVAYSIGGDLKNINDDEFLLQNRMDELMALKPDVIINIAAGKCGENQSKIRRNALRQNVLKHEIPLVFVNNVASKKEATYDGGSMIFGYESYVVASAPFFEEAVMDVNLECLISMKHEDEQQDYVL